MTTSGLGKFVSKVKSMDRDMRFAWLLSGFGVCCLVATFYLPEAPSLLGWIGYGFAITVPIQYQTQRRVQKSGDDQEEVDYIGKNYVRFHVQRFAGTAIAGIACATYLLADYWGQSSQQLTTVVWLFVILGVVIGYFASVKLSDAYLLRKRHPQLHDELSDQNRLTAHRLSLLSVVNVAFWMGFLDWVGHASFQGYHVGGAVLIAGSLTFVSTTAWLEWRQSR